MRNLQRIPRLTSSILSVGVFGIVGAWAYVGYLNHTRFDGTENYEIDFPRTFPGWKQMPRNPESLFVFANPKEGLLLRGSVSQVISEINPTPEMSTDGIAQFYIDCTHENMPDWTAKRDSDISGKNARFSVIERQQKAHAVLTAFAVKGNTTLMISASTRAADQKSISDAKSELGSYVKLVSLNPTDMGGGAEAARDSEQAMASGPVSMK